jgi:hypothetical protein
MASRRAPICVYEAIKDQLSHDSQRKWKSHHAVMDVCFPIDQKSIVITVTDKVEAQEAVSEFEADWISAKDVLLHHDFPWIETSVIEIPKIPLKPYPKITP